MCQLAMDPLLNSRFLLLIMLVTTPIVNDNCHCQGEDVIQQVIIQQVIIIAKKTTWLTSILLTQTKKKKKTLLIVDPNMMA